RLLLAQCEPLRLGVDLDEDVAGVHLAAELEARGDDAARDWRSYGVRRAVDLEPRFGGRLVDGDVGEDEPADPRGEQEGDDGEAEKRWPRAVGLERPGRSGE